MNSPYFNKTRLRALSEYANEQLQCKNFSGIAWSLEHRGEIVSEDFLGFADHALSNPVDSDTLYRLYSMTKPVISVRCLQLLEQGRLRLDDPISRWIPAFSQQRVLCANGSLEPLNRPITVEDLLTHRSGLSYDFLIDCPVAELYREKDLAGDGARSLKELVEQLAYLPLASQPGSRWYYSYATDVLAHLIECITQRSIAENLKSSLFEPLNMTDTGFFVNHKDQHRVADMFGQRELGDVDNGECAGNDLLAMNVEPSYPMAENTGFSRGGIGLFSTMRDYQRFMPVLMHGNTEEGAPLLSKPTLDMLWENRLSDSQMPIKIGDRAYHGYGWGLTGRVMADSSRASLVCVPGEGGWAGAASTYFWIDRQNAVSGIVMAQYLGSAIPLGPDMQSLAYSAFCNRLPG